MFFESVVYIITGYALMHYIVAFISRKKFNIFPSYVSQCKKFRFSIHLNGHIDIEEM